MYTRGVQPSPVGAASPELLCWSGQRFTELISVGMTQCCTPQTPHSVLPVPTALLTTLLEGHRHQGRQSEPPPKDPSPTPQREVPGEASDRLIHPGL